MRVTPVGWFFDDAEAFYRGVPEHIKNEIHRRAFPDEYWDVIRRFGDRVGFNLLVTGREVEK